MEGRAPLADTRRATARDGARCGAVKEKYLPCKHFFPWQSDLEAQKWQLESEVGAVKEKLTALQVFVCEHILSLSLSLSLSLPLSVYLSMFIMYIYLLQLFVYDTYICIWALSKKS